VLTRTVRALGPLRGPAAAAVGAAWYARLSSDDRVRAAANHHRLQPHLDHAAAAALARRSYQEYVRMIVDSMWADPLDSSQVLQFFRVHGAEHLDVGDRGSMVVLPHFGNWDMAASASLGLGLHLSTVMAPVVSPGITEMVTLSRPREGSFARCVRGGPSR
jgi:lauroyl/myristoyl acyltransferase